MSEFTEQEFNLAMAELFCGDENYVEHYGEILLDPSGSLVWDVVFNPYSDLNQLMPIAWKYYITVVFHGTPDGCNWRAEDLNGIYRREATPVEAIRQCLWQIYKEWKDDQNTE